MDQKRFTLRAKVLTESPDAVRTELRRVLPKGTVTLTGNPKELIVKGEGEGTSAAELNRSFLSTLRRVEKRTRLRSEWSFEGTTERFLDYAPKESRRVSKAADSPA